MSDRNEKKPTLKLQLESEPVECSTSGETSTVSVSILPQATPKYNGFVASALPHGKDNPIPGRVLVELLRLKNGRELTKLIEHERRAGVPICASVDSRNPGYYLADSSDELEAYITALDRRIKNVSLTRSYCARTLQGMKG